MRIGFALVAFICWTQSSALDWHEVSEPTAGPSQSIGGYTAGCVSGANALPPEGPGFQVMRRSRNRYYGHSQLIDVLQELGMRNRNQGHADFLVGDLSQPRGGRMNYGHRSHQIGLDADIWFRPAIRDYLPDAEREAISMRSVTVESTLSVIPELFTDRERWLLKQAAMHSSVERIFVNPVIKQALCETEVDASWLSKIRPWWGHDAHFHVRLACPENSPQCRTQNPVSQGSGCDASLQWWLDQLGKPAEPAKTDKPAKPKKRPQPPVECSAVFSER